jgi:hypothetical protein
MDEGLIVLVTLGVTLGRDDLLTVTGNLILLVAGGTEL